MALPKLQALWSEGQLENRYPQLNLCDLQDHVVKNGRRHHGRQADRRHEAALAQSPAGVWRKAGVEAGAWMKPRQPESPPPNVASSSTGGNPSNGRRGATHLVKRRRPRQPESPPPNVASSSTGGNPVNLEPVVLDSDAADEDSAGYDSGFTVLSSDESGASIFGLRSALHEVEEDDELSDSSSQGDGELAVAEKERVSRWRTDNFLLDSLDFAYVFMNFEEAYSHA